MYKFKKIFIFIKDTKVDATDVLGDVRIESMSNAQEFLKKEGFEHFMFTLKEVSE